MTQTAAEGLRIGWAQRDITPRLPVVVSGQFHVRVAHHVEDPLTVTALTLSRGDHSVVLVSCDNARAPAAMRDRCKEALRERVPDLDPEALVVSATHTHTAPTMIEGKYPPQNLGEMTVREYQDLFVERTTEAVEEAWQGRSAGAVGWGLGHAVVGHNRRASYFAPPGDREGKGGVRLARAPDGYSRMYGDTNDPNFSHIEGHEDHSLDLLFTWDQAGGLTGVIVNVACPSQQVESESFVSADFWHDVRTQLRARLGEGLYVLPQCSAAGDQSPRPLLHKRAEERMLRLRGLARREEIGRRITAAVQDVLPFAREEAVSDAPLRRLSAETPVDRWMITEEEVAEAREQLAAWESHETEDAREESIRYVQMTRCRHVMDRFEAQQTQPQMMEEVTAVRLGDVAFATNRFELYLDFGERIKARSPALQTFVVQLTAGSERTGSYLPTQRAVAGASYGTGPFSNEIGPEGGQQLLEHTLRLLQELWEDDERA